jgi:hypothetical protein
VSAVERAANSAILTLIARGMMIIGAGVGLPVAGWMMTRIVAKADKVIDTVDEIVVEQKVMKNSVEFKFDAIKTELGNHRTKVDDHEGRIRIIESRSPSLTTPR